MTATVQQPAVVLPGRRGTPVLLGCAGLAGAVAVRVAVAGPEGARSPLAGLVFALALLVLTAALRATADRRPVRGGMHPGRAVLAGAAGAAVLCAGPLLRPDGLTVVGTDGFLPWVLVVSVVAAAEELLLRGALFDAVLNRWGAHLAILVTSVGFALLHAPVYGLRVLPLDLAVGFGLGALRLATGGVTAPLTAHLLADVAGWWLR